MPRIVQIAVGLEGTDGALERDLYALDDEGHVWTFTFETWRTGEWVRMPDLPSEDAA